MRAPKAELRETVERLRAEYEEAEAAFANSVPGSWYDKKLEERAEVAYERLQDAIRNTPPERGLTCPN